MVTSLLLLAARYVVVKEENVARVYEVIVAIVLCGLQLKRARYLAVSCTRTPSTSKYHPPKSPEVGYAHRTA